MRIACIHIPQFALQCATRLDPSLRGAPVAVVSGVEPGRERAGVLHAPVVLACSRAAWALGVRLGMTAVTAQSVTDAGLSGSSMTRGRSQSEQLVLVTADAAAERETARAVADAVLASSPTVDVGGRVGAGGAHLAMYCEVPGKTRGTSFGDKLVELLAELGLSARIGIADDRFTAWVAAAYGPPAAIGAKAGRAAQAQATPPNAPSLPGVGVHESHDHDGAVVSVPRGGSPAFLSPRPLSLLAIPAEVQHMLESLGVTTLGEFAALPAPSVARPFEADYQGLARGESGATLRPYHPDAAVREEIVVSASTVLELPGSLSGPSAIAQIARRIALRLAGRGRGAARLDVAMIAADGELREVPVTIDGTVADAEEIARVLAPVLDTVQDDMPTLASHGGWRLRVVVTGEAVIGGEAIEILAEGTAPFVRVAGVPNPSVPIAPPPPMPRQAANTNAETRVLDRQTRLDSYQPAAEPSSDPHPHSDPHIDPLAVVLSSSGSLFALSAPSGASDRRDAHRRTRRGKQRRTRPTPQVQRRLFDRLGSK
ncbi:MAG TPA: hypothetical protein VL326_30475 [Kofleriaceae bacterium]|nr:hypothetical protein [Kofleriaceae bacterium]